MVELDFTRCRKVWVPDDSDAGGFWSPPPEHVKVGVRAIIKHPWFLLADDMGGMKTAQAIIAAQFLHDAGIIDRVIVVTPASIRGKVWFDRDLGQLAEQVFDDKHNSVTEYHQKIKKWSQGDETKMPLKWVITNYEFIRQSSRLNVLLTFCGPKTMLIFDESSAVRTWNSAQTQACMKLRWQTRKSGTAILGAERCGRVLELNGTPIAETPLDLFAQGNLLHPSILHCEYITHFKAQYAEQQIVRGPGGRAVLNPRTGKPLLEIAGWKDLPALQAKFAPYILRREAKDFGVDFALPPVGYDVYLTDATWKIYKDMRDDLVAQLQSGVVTAAQAGVKTLRLSQITSGILGGVEDEMGGGISRTEEIGREKLDFMLAWHAERLTHDPNFKLLTWCRFVPELQRYLRETAKFGHTMGAVCGQPMFGGNLVDERNDALRLLHPRTTPPGAVTVGGTQGTGALGLNFTACRTAMDMSFDFSSFKKKQGDARLNRTGQRHMVSFFYLTAVGPRGQKTIDHHVMLERTGKMRVADLTTQGWVQMLKEE